MEICQLFKQTMNRHGIQGKELAELAGISQNHLSQFRSGKKWVSPEVFAALLEGMDQLSPGSRAYFCQLLAQKPLLQTESNDSKLRDLIEAADEEEIDEILLIIGRKWKQNAAIAGRYSLNKNVAISV
jgi:transcriptional regulator with XRE-family HTH domain